MPEYNEGGELCEECKQPSYVGHAAECSKKDAQSSEKESSSSCDKARREQETRAVLRNSYRSIWKKSFGIDKVDSMDMAVEEAMKMDEEMDKMLKSGEAKTTAEAIEILNQSEEFKPKETDVIFAEERFRKEVPLFAAAVEENDFQKASEFINAAQLEIRTRTDQETLERIIAPIIKEKFNKLIKQKDGESFIEAFEQFKDLKKITKDDFSGTAPEGLKSPEVVNAVKEYLVKQFKTYSLDVFIMLRDQMIKIGFVDSGEVNKMKEIIDIAKEKLIDRFKDNNDVNDFERSRDKTIEAGILTEKEVENWPEIIELRSKLK